MEEKNSGILDGTLLEYTYPELGTVIVEFYNGLMRFEWIAGPLKGEVGKDFVYRARELGESRYFVSWHEPEQRGFVTLFADLEKGSVCSSVLAGYATEDEQVLFHEATIQRVKRPGARPQE